jgi:riboflavin biosynthesis pyrimidine reductase
MRDFEVLFDSAEPGKLEHPAYGSYGPLGFPAPPAERPWVYTNFVQSLDGIASLRGRHASGFHIARSEEDAWLMDLLRAHADALLIGIGTLLEGTANNGGKRGPLYRIRREPLLDLRRALGKGAEHIILATGSGNVDLAEHRIFDDDGSGVRASILTTRSGAAALRGRGSHAHTPVMIAGVGALIDLPAALALLRREHGIEHLLCEGGPTLNGAMTRARLVDERFLTVSPVEFGQEIPPEQERGATESDVSLRLRPTTITGPGFLHDGGQWWRWLSCRRAGDHQFNRYRRRET